MLGQHGLDIRLDLPRQNRRGAFSTNGHNNRIAVHYGGGDEVTLIGFIQHVDPGASPPRPVCKLSIHRFILRSSVDQPHALEISRTAGSRLQRQSSLIRPLTHRLRGGLTEQGHRSGGFKHRAAFGLCKLTLAHDDNVLGFGADKYR